MWKAVIAIMLCCAAGTAVAQDIKGAKDHPLLPRFESSEIIRYEQREFADYQLAIAPIRTPGGKQKNPESVQSLEGKLTQIGYRAPADRSPLEVARNDEEALNRRAELVGAGM